MSKESDFVDPGQEPLELHHMKEHARGWSG